jgi:hypothetical protein
VSVAICPECVAGKHINCDGIAWDLDTDGPTICSCPATDKHPQQRLSCGCLVVVASRTMVEACEAHGQPLGPVSLASAAPVPVAEEPVPFPWEAPLPPTP